MLKNIFVVGLDDFHLSQLQNLARADAYRFHSLISYKKIKCGETFPVREFLQQAPRTLAQFDGTVDAVIGFWDFPVSTLLPIIQKQAGLIGPSLNAVLKCEHKYWSRLEQAKAVPEMIPPFQKIDPFQKDPSAQCRLPFPFWLKPVKSVLSYLGFLIRDQNEFLRNIEVIREGIGRYADPFNVILNAADLPPEIKAVDGYHCIAEGLISKGRQCTLEGYAHKGRIHVYGIIDSIRGGPHQSCFSRYQYPSQLPAHVQQRMIAATKSFMAHIGYDNSPFNIEFYWDHKEDAIWLLEINTRISKSHCPLFKMVDGEYHHDVLIDVALGKRPDFPYRQGKFRTAAKFMVRCHRDGRVMAVPNQAEVDTLRERFPETQIVIYLKAGMRLSDLRDQDSYSYEIADLFLGADSQEELLQKYRTALAMLPFTIDHGEEAP
jgi:hypothetical protein